MQEQELPPKPDRSFFEALEGKSSQISEIVDTLHQEQVGTPIYISYEERKPTSSDTLSRIEAVQRNDLTQTRQFLAGISLPLTVENTTQCALLLNNGKMYIVEKKNEADRWNMFSKLTGERPLYREAGNRPKSMNPADQFELEDLDKLTLENSYNAQITHISTRNSFEEIGPLLKQAFISAKEVRDRRIARQQENESLAYKLFKNIFGGGAPEQTSQNPEPGSE